MITEEASASVEGVINLQVPGFGAPMLRPVLMRLRQSLELSIQELGNGERTLVQHCTEKLYVSSFQVSSCLPDGFASGLIRFNDQNDSIGQLSHQGCLSFTGKR